MRGRITHPAERLGGPEHRHRLHRFDDAGTARTPADLIGRAAVVVVDTYDEVVNGSGDMIAARADGVDVDSVVVTLNAVLSGATRIDPEQGIRIYKSTGSGLQDVVVAEMLLNRAGPRASAPYCPSGIVTTRK